MNEQINRYLIAPKNIEKKHNDKANKQINKQIAILYNQINQDRFSLYHAYLFS